MTIKLLNVERAVIKKDYEFAEGFNIFDEIGNKHHKRFGYKPRFSNKINTKNAMLEYLKIIENKLVDCFLLLVLLKKINNANRKGYVHDKF